LIYYENKQKVNRKIRNLRAYFYIFYGAGNEHIKQFQDIRRKTESDYFACDCGGGAGKREVRRGSGNDLRIFNRFVRGFAVFLLGDLLFYRGVHSGVYYEILFYKIASYHDCDDFAGMRRARAF